VYLRKCHSALVCLRGRRSLSATRVLAIVVTFAPDTTFGVNLEALRREIAEIVVVDNRSTNVSEVVDAAARVGCRLLRNDSNRGVAAALNQGVRIALDEGFQWVALFDQDSLLSPGFMHGLLTLLNGPLAGLRVGILAGASRDQMTGALENVPWQILHDRGRWREMRTVITSGSLVRIDAIKAAGFFDETLFIDCVDHEFCARCRRAGYQIFQAPGSVFRHSLGHATRHRLLGRPVLCTNHSARRWYFMVRNQLEFCRRVIWFDAVLGLRSTTAVLTRLGLMVLFEKDRAGKLKAAATGVLDFTMRRFGAHPDERVS
jgi:rhamnosyltransferase